MGELHIGQIVSQLMDEKKLRTTDVANSMDVKSQSLHSAFSRQNWGTDYLQKFMAATGIRSWEVFQDGPPAGVSQVSGPVVGNGNKVNVVRLEGEVEGLRKEVDLLRTLLAEKERTIQLLLKSGPYET